jgi:hypothetical protein
MTNSTDSLLLTAGCSSPVRSLRYPQPPTTSPRPCTATRLSPREYVPQLKGPQKIQRYSARSHFRIMNSGPTQACETQTATAVSFSYTSCKSQLTQKKKTLVVPLRTVLHTSSLFLAANSASLTEAAIVKSLRAHARDTFDIRMIVVDKMRSRCGHHGYALAGGYEVRRKGWAEVTQRFPTFTAEYWDAQTIYIVRSPLLLAGLRSDRVLHSS